MSFLWGLVAVSAMLGCVFGIIGILGASSAIQEQAAATVALAAAVVPYVFARAIDHARMAAPTAHARVAAPPEDLG